MGHRLADLLPDLAASVASALRSEGYTAVADSLAAQFVERCTYDPQANAGYVYLSQSKPVHHGETPAAETIAFASPHWFNVDLRSSGAVLGIELLSPSQAFKAISVRVP
jgi:uncharacterized protein YuzE